MFIAKFDNMSGFILALGKVPDLEVFILINSKELADSGGKPCFIITKVLRPLEVFICFYLRILEVKKTPLDLSDWKLALMVPH